LVQFGQLFLPRLIEKSEQDKARFVLSCDPFDVLLLKQAAQQSRKWSELQKRHWMQKTRLTSSRQQLWFFGTRALGRFN